MTRSEILEDVHKAAFLAERMIQLGMNPEKVQGWLITATEFYSRCLDELDGAAS